MSSNIFVLKAKGLNTSPNELDREEGSLIEANNIVIRRDGIVEPVRGFKIWGTPYADRSYRTKQLMSYRDRILRHYNNKIQFDNQGDGNFLDFAGTHTEAETGLRTKTLEMNGNLYLTSSEGIKKISAKTADDFTQNDNYITSAGAVKAVDFKAELVYSAGDASGYLKADSTTQYQTLWAKKDLNNNLLLGSPSQAQSVTSSLQQLLFWDFNRLLSFLDGFSSPSLINDGSAISLAPSIADGSYLSSLGITTTGTSVDLRTKLINLTKKIDADIYLGKGTALNGAKFIINSATITGTSTNETAAIKFTTSADPTTYLSIGKYLYIKGVTVTVNGVSSISFEGIRPITAIDSTSFTVSFFDKRSNKSSPNDLKFSAFPTKGTSNLSNYYLDITDKNIYLYDGYKYNTASIGTGVASPVVTNATVTYAEYQTLDLPIEMSTTDTYTTNYEWTQLQSFLQSISIKLYSELPSIIKATDIIRVSSSDITLEFASYSVFPSTGDTTKVYLALDTGKTYKWLVESPNPGRYYEVNSFELTTTNSVKLTITIPENITDEYFYQVYRSIQITAADSGISSYIEGLTPSGTLQLAYEGYPTATELANKQIVITDSTPDEFLGAYLYTNASQEGAMQANETPPFAKDINRFKETMFYANTRSKHSLNLSLLGVTKLINDYKIQEYPTLTIATKSGNNNIYHFITGVKQQTPIAVTKTATELKGKFFFIYSSANSYYVWFQVKMPDNSTNADPRREYPTFSAFPAAPSPLEDGVGVPYNLYIAKDTKTVYKWNGAGYTQIFTYTSDIFEGIKIAINSTDTALTIATKMQAVFSTYSFDFSEVKLDTGNFKITLVDINYGEIPKIQEGTTGMINSSAVTLGKGESIGTEVFQINTLPYTAYNNSGTATYIRFYSVDNQEQYVIWFKRGSATSPGFTNATLIQVNIYEFENISTIATDIFNAIPSNFIKSTNGLTVTVSCLKVGNCTAPTTNNGSILNSISHGSLNVLLSDNDSSSIAIDETARSLIRIINKNKIEEVSGYYLSGPDDIPGQILLEGRSLSSEEFYIMANNTNTGSSFNPDISPLETISITPGATTIITTPTTHGLIDGDYVFINSTKTTPAINGLYPVKFVSTTSFSIALTTLNPSSPTLTGYYAKASDAIVSTNEIKPNRIYYSKYQQPEAVPYLNYFDVGAEEKPILRIFPLRDSLFVFKSDGLYRVSGESAPFSKSLFDSSVILIAPDSVCVVDNLVYCWSTQGIQVVSESGAQTISRPIDNEILKIASSNYTNFPTLTWGIGYGSDSSVTMWTSNDINGTTANIGYRYNTLTNSWTTINKSPTCGIVFDYDGKMYLGPSDIIENIDVNSIEQERKSFDRTDNAGKEYIYQIGANQFWGEKIKFNSVSQLDIGDAIVQQQKLSIYDFNLLLSKLDNDALGFNDYITLSAIAGDNLRTKIEQLASKLNTDTVVSGTNYLSSIIDIPSTSQLAITQVISGKEPIITTASAHGLITGRKITISNSMTTPSIDGTYDITYLTPTTFKIKKTVYIGAAGGTLYTNSSDLFDIAICYNKIIELLNADSGVPLNNYKPVISIHNQEAIILDINLITKEVTLTRSLDYVQGNVTVYKAIPASYTYSPNTFGDPLNYKHLRQATIMTYSRALTKMSVEFKTDLKPVFIGVDFYLNGSGLFGNNSFGDDYYGGQANSAPLRTIIPRDCQRCRYLTTRVKHSVAREQYQITGVSLTGSVGISERAYR